jgi:exonuclease III
MDRIARRGFRDLDRRHYPDAREFSWYSAAGNGYRIDRAFGSERLAMHVVGVHYSHDERLQGSPTPRSWCSIWPRRRARARRSGV